MKPEIKAMEFCVKFGEAAPYVVDEIISAMEIFGYTSTMYDDPETGQIKVMDNDGDPVDYWRQVKKHLENL